MNIKIQHIIGMFTWMRPRPPPCKLFMCQHKHNTISNYYAFCDGDGTTATRIRITLNCNLSSNKSVLDMNNTFQTPDHAGERDYEALLLAHGLVDTIEKHDGNVNFYSLGKRC